MKMKIEHLFQSDLRGGTLERDGQSRQPSDNGRDKGWNVIDLSLLFTV